MDMNGAFLHGDLTKESHMEQRPSFVWDGNICVQTKEVLGWLETNA